MNNVLLMGGNNLKTIPVFVDNFTIAKAAPLGSPLACDVLGQWTVTDTENKLSISDGKLNFAPNAVADFGVPRAFTNIPTKKVTGTCLVGKGLTKTGNCFLGFGASAAAAPTMLSFRHETAAMTLFVNGNVVTTVSSAPPDIVITLSTNAAFFFGKVSGAWKLLYVSFRTYNTVYAGFTAYSATGTVEKMAVYTLPAPFNTDYGLATYRFAGAIPDGTTFTHNPNAGIGVTATTLAASQVVKFRVQDANNYWAVNVAADGSFTLSEVVAGTPTTRGTAAASSIANGQRLGIIADAATIRVLANDVSKIYYTGATNFQTATAGSVSIGTGAISDLACWPVEITGRAARILDKVTR
jgi:hypothetical protein